MSKIRTVLFGLGTVNTGLLKILRDKRSYLKDHYNAEFVIVGVTDSSGLAFDADGFDYDQLIDLKARKGKVHSLPAYAKGVSSEFITEYIHQADLLIESSPADLQTGGPGLIVAKESLRKGWSVVFANKAPLVLAFDELKELSVMYGSSMRWSATVCGGLPVINVLQRDMKATTNYILQQMEEGGNQEEAIREAQRIGAAEADPSHDTKGYDTANKLLIIMKTFVDYRGTLAGITIEGIESVTPLQIAEAKARGNKIKLLASAAREDGQWKLAIKPTEVSAQSFLGTCNGWEMGIELETDLYELICMKNYEADPVGTSAAVLRDALDISLSK
jgi:homoserine dehydrogenase